MWVMGLPAFLWNVLTWDSSCQPLPVLFGAFSGCQLRGGSDGLLAREAASSEQEFSFLDQFRIFDLGYRAVGDK